MNNRKISDERRQKNRESARRSRNMKKLRNEIIFDNIMKVKSLIFDIKDNKQTVERIIIILNDSIDIMSNH